MLRSPTATGSRMPVRIGTATSATDRFVSSVYRRLMATGCRLTCTVPPLSSLTSAPGRPLRRGAALDGSKR